MKKKILKTLSTRKKVGGVEVVDLIPALVLFGMAWFGDFTIFQKGLIVFAGWKSVGILKELKGRFSRNFKNLLLYKLRIKRLSNLPNYEKNELIG